MKKIIYITLITVTALSACTKIEQGERTGREISFAVGSYAERTKANEALNTSLLFRSRAFLHATGLSVQDMFGAGAGEQVGYVSGIWQAGAVSGNEYHWPVSDGSYVNFVSWYDKNGNPDTANLSETSLQWTDRTIVADDDILYADEAWRYSEDTSNGTHFTGDAITSGVPTLFHHALAQICFKAKIASGKNVDGTTTWEITLKNFSLAGVYKKGSLDLSNSDLGSTGTKAWTITSLTEMGGEAGWTWDSTGGTESFTDANSSLALTTTAQDVLAMRTVLPQAVTSNMILSFTWTITTKVNGTTVLEEDVPYSKALNAVAPSITDWNMGYQITYTLSFDPTTEKIQIVPSLSNWVEVDTGDIVK